MKNISGNLKTATALLLVLFSGRILADAPLPAKAGVCFRFDDNQPPAQWREMGALFESYGCRMCLSLISQNLNAPESRSTLRELANKGHLMLDHLPSHAVYQISARNPEEFRKFAALPITDHADPVKKTVYFKYELNAEHPKNISFQGAIREGILCDYPPEMHNRLAFTRKILVPETGTVYGIRIQNGKKTLYSFWGEKVNIPNREKSRLILLANNEAIQPPDDLLRFLAECSRGNFTAIGLPPPHTWIQPGGWECFVTPGKIAAVYGKEFGYRSGSCVPGAPTNTICGFREPNPGLLRFNMCADSTVPDNGKSLEQMKLRIADTIAKHRVLILISHMVVRRVPGGWKTYLSVYEELLKWLKNSGIPVATQEQWAEILYSGQAGPEGNIMPSLTTDLNGDGRPDGYELRKGTSVQLKTGTATIPPGGSLLLSDLAGVEKGNNSFALTARGDAGTLLTLELTLLQRDNRTRREKREFRLKKDWQTFLLPVSVSPETAVLHCSISQTGGAQPVEVRDLSFAKSNP